MSKPTHGCGHAIATWRRSCSNAVTTWRYSGSNAIVMWRYSCGNAIAAWRHSGSNAIVTWRYSCGNATATRRHNCGNAIATRRFDAVCLTAGAGLTDVLTGILATGRRKSARQSARTPASRYDEVQPGMMRPNNSGKYNHLSTRGPPEGHGAPGETRHASPHALSIRALPLIVYTYAGYDRFDD